MSVDAADPTDLAAELHARGEQALDEGDLAAADQLAAQAFELFASADSEHVDVANALVLRARIAHTRSDFSAARVLAEHAVTITTNALGEWPDEDIVAILHGHAIGQLAASHHGLGQYDDAERILLAALAALEARLAPDAAEIGELLNLLGITHKYQARYDEAAARYARALDIVRAHHADDSPELASLEHNVGGLAHARGEPALAEPHARRSVELREAALGPDHAHVAADLAALAAILDDLGKLDEAEAAYRRALAIFERAFGTRHFEVGYTLGSLGALYAGAERWTDAQPLLERAHEVLVDVLGDDHVEVARIDQYLAVVAHARGDRAVAMRHAERALAACERAFPADHPRTCDARDTRDAIEKS